MYSEKEQLKILDLVTQEQYNDIHLTDPNQDYNFKQLITDGYIVAKNSELGTHEKQYPNKVLPVVLTAKGEQYRQHLRADAYMSQLQWLRDEAEKELLRREQERDKQQQERDKRQKMTDWFLIFTAIVTGCIFIKTLLLIILTIKLICQ